MHGLVTLIKLLVRNAAAVAGDDWLKSQMERAEEPQGAAGPARPAEAEGFREVAYRQAAPGNLDEAKLAMKSMVGL